MKPESITQRGQRIQMNTESTKRTENREDDRGGKLSTSFRLVQPSEFDIQIDSLLRSVNLYTYSEAKLVNAKLFALARGLRTLFGFEITKPGNNFKPILRRWYKASMQFLPEKSFDLIWAQFVKCWKKVKVPTDADVFYQLLCVADKSPYPPISKNYDDIARDVIRICAVLDAYSSPTPFFLACRVASDIFDYSHSTMADILGMLVDENVLELVEKGRLGRASRYRFLEDRGKIDLRLIKSIQHVNKEVD